MLSAVVRVQWLLGKCDSFYGIPQFVGRDAQLPAPVIGHPPGSPASLAPVFPFDEIVVGFVTINSASLSILSTSSAIVDECEGCVFRIGNDRFQSRSG